MKDEPSRMSPATYLHERVRSIDFDKPGFNREDPAIGLTFLMKEPVPDYLFLRLQFDLLIPMPANAERNGQRTTQAIGFQVDDVLAIAIDAYRLSLRPRPRTGPLDDDRRMAFLSLADGASLHRLKDGSPRDWRHDVIRVRFHHAKQPQTRHAVRNPRYAELPVAGLSTLLAQLPKKGGREDDRQALDELLASADAAFSEHESPRPKSESFGYANYLLQQQDEPVEEFDLDGALLEELMVRSAS